jgi:hypothetical protein
MAPSGLGGSIEMRMRAMRAVRRVLRPLIRLLIRSGFSFEEFAEVARGAYVESIIRESSDRASVPLTRERVGLLAGLSTQQVDFYIEHQQPLPRTERLHVAAEVLHRWFTDPRYLVPYGVPIELEFDAPDQRSFQTLVSEVDPKTSAGLLLEALLRAGSVAYSGEKRFRAVSRYYIIPDAFSSQTIQSFGEQLVSLTKTLEHNFNALESENKRFERSVFADRGLPESLLPSFETYARERSSRFLDDVDDWLARCADGDTKGSGPHVRAGVNVFLYVESSLNSGPLKGLVRAPRKTGAL